MYAVTYSFIVICFVVGKVFKRFILVLLGSFKHVNVTHQQDTIMTMITMIMSFIQAFDFIIILTSGLQYILIE